MDYMAFDLRANLLVLYFLDQNPQVILVSAFQYSM